MKNIFTRFWSISKKSHCSQADAAVEVAQADASNTVRDRDTRQAGAIIKWCSSNAGDTARNGDARQADECFEGPFPDAGEFTVFSESDTLQAEA